MPWLISQFMHTTHPIRSLTPDAHFRSSAQSLLHRPCDILRRPCDTQCLSRVFCADPVTLPIRILALASAALGLHLSAKKTFAGLTCLEILGIEIDSVTQTVGITAEQRANTLSQCQKLIKCGTADLLDMQSISGLLHFHKGRPGRLFPCGMAFLRRLYECTHCSPRPSSCHWIMVRHYGLVTIPTPCQTHMD
ncbi:uncharacterized protein UBRO_20497 [Ustilago bromivora]|uniref:Uncharacterized protein n=1 Tax=Ustilago bromivora TaxID=307758 RepID=A0A1K0FYF8_9BASI|nr:uncharacterized protein UBRO_20497 [Ustilago bromivora]